MSAREEESYRTGSSPEQVSRRVPARRTRLKLLVAPSRKRVRELERLPVDIALEEAALRAAVSPERDAESDGTSSESVSLSARRTPTLREAARSSRRLRMLLEWVSSSQESPLLSYLEDRAVRPGTAKRYRLAMTHLLKYCREQGLPLVTDTGVDAALVSFLNNLYTRKQQAHYANVVMAGFIHTWPEYREVFYMKQGGLQ